VVYRRAFLIMLCVGILLIGITAGNLAPRLAAAFRLLFLTMLAVFLPLLKIIEELTTAR
jgi:hypothetical protein